MARCIKCDGAGRIWTERYPNAPSALTAEGSYETCPECKGSGWLTTEQALELSIAHWIRLAAGQRHPGEYPNSDNCALCQEFLAKDCEGCPVAERTGAMLCIRSPYEDAASAANRYGYDSPEFKAAAQAELDFLISLRKPGEQS